MMSNRAQHKVSHILAVSAIGGILGLSSAAANTLIVTARTSAATVSTSTGLATSNTSPSTAPTSGCSYGSSYADGCLGVASYGNFQNSLFFSYGKQSGQRQYYNAAGLASGHPPPWNVAGVDYPVGYSTVSPLKDPAAGGLPAGCTYNPRGSRAGGAIVVCQRIKNVTLQGWDFSLHNCTVLDIKNDTTGTITLSNNKFVNGPNCSITNGYLATIENSAKADLVFTHNYVDGLAKTYTTSLTAMIGMHISGSLTVTYNAFFHSPGRPLSGSALGAMYFAYNYFEGFVYHSTDSHGEVMLDLFNGTQLLQTYSFNTVLQPNDVINGSTTTFYLSTGAAGTGSTIVKAQVDHNTVVINKAVSGVPSTAAALAETAYDIYGSVVLNDNYADGTGSYKCFISTSAPVYRAPPILTGNISMLTGKPVNAYGAPC